ncbi:hypothetical protein ABIB25_002726 [Nakamurella sp. UYEF19]|uniref:suppressor of fused domain protein n=1 Tax=Nakamurella sp. UYEF19 TaxID=1756392 RepID=UPI0033939BE8
MTAAQVEAHFGRFLGAGELVEEYRSIQLWAWRRPEFSSFSTLGLSDAPVTSVFPQEIVCSVLPDQLGAADFLVRKTLDLVLDAGAGLVNEDVIPNGEILLAGTVIEGVLVGPHPMLDDEFDVLRDGSAVIAEMMTLVPLSGAEIAYSQSESIDALMDRLEEADPPLLDVLRASIV